MGFSSETRMQCGRNSTTEKSDPWNERVFRDCSRDPGFDMDRAGDHFYTTGPNHFSQGSQRCLDRVNTCQTPPRALSTSRTSQYPNWDCIAETISTLPVHDVAISPLATPRTSA